MIDPKKSRETWAIIKEIIATLRAKGLTYADLAAITGVSRRTAEGWGQGRTPSRSALILLKRHLDTLKLRNN